MAVMMNTLGRRAQAQSDDKSQAQAEGGETLVKEKVTIYFISIVGTLYLCP